MKFFSSILKQKKTVTFALLFLVFTGVIIPHTTFAAWPWNLLSDIASGITNGLIYVSMFVPLFITALFADIAGTLLKWALLISTGGINYTTGPAVNIGWPIIRDLANMMVVLGFVIIGIATTLRIQDYQAKKTLIPLIIAAILINFSLLICGIFIDASNIATNFFFSKIGNTFFANENIKNTIVVLGNLPTDSPFAFGPKLLAMTMFNFFIFFIYALYLILILGRIVALWILVILAPLAFVCYVFPATKKIWQMWWSNFSQWCIIGIPAGLFLYVGSQMMAGIIKIPAPTIVSPNGIFDAETAKIITGFATFFLPGLFLIGGFLVSLQFSAMGAGAIINYTNRNKGKIVGGGFSMMSKAADTAGNKMSQLGGYMQTKGGLIGKTGWVVNKAGQGTQSWGNLRASSQKTRSAFGRGLETVGLRDEGVTAMKQAGAVEEEAKTIKFKYDRAKVSGDIKTVESIRNDARIAQGSKGAASLKAVADAKDLHKTFKNAAGGMDFAAAASRLSYAENVGAKDIVKDSEKKMPGLAAHNKVTVKELLNTINPATGANYTASEASREAVRRKNIEMSPSDMRDLHESQINADHLEDVSYKTFARAVLDYKTDQRAKAKTLLSELRDRTYITLGATGATPADRAAQYKAMTKGAKAARIGALSTADKAKIRDLNSKIVIIKEL